MGCCNQLLPDARPVARIFTGLHPIEVCLFDEDIENTIGADFGEGGCLAVAPIQISGKLEGATVRGVDVMIDMPEKKYLSGTVKDGA